MKKYEHHSVFPINHGTPHKQCYLCLIIRNEVAFDIHHFTYKVAKIAFAELDATTQKQVVLSKDNADWLDRHITTAISKVKASIQFAVMRNSRMASDEIIDSPDQFPINLSFDDSWNGDPQVLCDNIHDYIVKQCIADWSKHALPARYESLQNDAEEALREIHTISCYTSYTL